MKIRNHIFKSYLRNSLKSFSTSNINSNLSDNALSFPERTVDYFINPNKYNYLDKTKYFENILSNNKTEIFYQPDSFGKTFNLEMFRYFISDVKKVDDCIDIKKREEFFKNKQIFQNSEIVQNHFSKHPVIYLNFKELDENNFEDNMEKFKLILNTQIEQIFQYESKNNLDKFEMKICEEFLNNTKTSNLQFLTNLPKELSKILNKLSENNPFILINNYDFPLIHSYGKASHDQFKSFLEMLVRNTFRNNNYIYKGILTGVNELDHKFIFSNLNNLKIHSFKDNKDIEYKNFFGVSLEKEENLKMYKDNISKYNEFPNELNKTLSFYNFSGTYNKINLNTYHEENLVKYFNIENISEYLNINNLFSNIVNENSLDYLDGYKILNLINNKAENFINKFYSNNTEFLNKSFNDESLPFDIETNKFYSFTNQIHKNSFLSHLLSNNIIQLDSNNNIKIPNLLSALIIKNTFSKLQYHKDDHNRKLAYIFYKYLYFNKINEYFSEIKSIYDSSRKTGIPKKADSNKQINLVFKTEKEFEEYFTHIMSLELNLMDSKENIFIYRVEDLDDFKVSDLLKEFTLITFNDRKFAIYVRFNKYKLSNIQAGEDLGEIDELQNIEVVQKASVKKRIHKTNSDEVVKILQNINNEKISKLDQEEAVKYLSHISDQFESVAFASLANYQKFFEYTVNTFLITKE